MTKEVYLTHENGGKMRLRDTEANKELIQSLKEIGYREVESEK